MEAISYHSYTDKLKHTLFACNSQSDRLPLVVNCAGVTVSKWEFKTNNPCGRLDYYFLYLKSGSMIINIANDALTVHSGTLVIIPPNTSYMYHHTDSQEMIYYWVHFTGSSVESILQSFDMNSLPLILNIPHISSSIDYQMAKIFDIYIKKGHYRDNELSHCLNAMLIEIAKHSGKADTEHRRLSRSIQYINNNYTLELKIPELAEMESLSVSRYISLFNEIMHTSPYQYIIGLRMNAACEMLLNSNLSVTRISELLGFQSVFFFSKLFKKHMNISPVQYKKKHLNNSQ